VCFDYRRTGVPGWMGEKRRQEESKYFSKALDLTDEDQPVSIAVAAAAAVADLVGLIIIVYTVEKSNPMMVIRSFPVQKTTFRQTISNVGTLPSNTNDTIASDSFVLWFGKTPREWDLYRDGHPGLSILGSILPAPWTSSVLAYGLYGIVRREPAFFYFARTVRPFFWWSGHRHGDCPDETTSSAKIATIQRPPTTTCPLTLVQYDSLANPPGNTSEVPFSTMLVQRCHGHYCASFINLGILGRCISRSHILSYYALRVGDGIRVRGWRYSPIRNGRRRKLDQPRATCRRTSFHFLRRIIVDRVTLGVE
jgi:hypothetical protein